MTQEPGVQHSGILHLSSTISVDPMFYKAVIF